MKIFSGKILLLVFTAVLAIALAMSFVTSPASAQLGNPVFANPPEVRSRAADKRLRAVIELINGEYLIPNVGKEELRQFHGWDATMPRPAPRSTIGPGPTLRARVGDRIQVAFLNKVNEQSFPYSFVTGADKPPFSDAGCDKVGLPNAQGKFQYPGSDKYPNCFHGSSTANIHYHGTHTSPDGLGDNVLVQVLPDPAQPNWTTVFNMIFNSSTIPQKWDDLPLQFRTAQLNLVSKRDAKQKAEAIANGLRPPEPMLTPNKERIAAGYWPQYFIGAFPNYFELPDYDLGRVKAGQAPGTHWYHAHKHGSTSLHIRNGLAGVFVIESNKEGGYDHFIRKELGWGPEYGAKEKILIFQQYDPTQNLERPRPGGTVQTGRGSRQVLVNGQLTPTIIMRPGEIQLWRMVNGTEGNTAGMINAGNSQTGLFNATQFKAVQTAQDGVQFSPANYTNQPYLSGKVPNGVLPNGTVPNGLILGAGNRADILVKAPTTIGTYPFISVSGNSAANATLFFVNVTGERVSPDQSFPTTWLEMPKYLLDLPKPGPNDIKNPNSPVKFQWESGRTGPGLNPSGDAPHFMINNKQFGETGEIVDQCMPQDGLQDWVLENYTAKIAHPFHIHINPFQIVEMFSPVQNITYRPADQYIWQDVIAIPPAKIDGTQVTPGRVIIRQKYPDFHGTFVLHCHILAHEDRGMMQLVRIVPLNKYPAGCQDHPPKHH